MSPASGNDRLLTTLSGEYRRAFPTAVAAHERALRSMVAGGSHTARLFDPAPFRVTGAQGAWVEDSDGHHILDFWQGHYSNLLGHNPPLVTRALFTALHDGWGLQTGLADETEVRFAELLCRLTGAERVRFTTSGAVATLNAIMLAKGATGRSGVLKVQGGWQGAQPMAFKGVTFRDGYDHIESAGISDEDAANVVLTRFNDPQHLSDAFAREGDRLACFIVEPFMGIGGFVPADPDYLRLARELTHRHGAVLIFDEIISGFRFCASGVQRLYGVTPDLTTYGKIAGGGMPLAALAGSERILRLCGPEEGRRVRFDGGTFSAHPAALMAGEAVLGWLADHEDEVYGGLAAAGERLRRGVEQAFAAEGLLVRCTGDGNEAVPGSSLAMVHFPHDPDLALDRPDAIWDPDHCDVVRREEVLKLAYLLEGVHVVHGLGALSAAHDTAALERHFEASRAVARRLAG